MKTYRIISNENNSISVDFKTKKDAQWYLDRCNRRLKILKKLLKSKGAIMSEDIEKLHFVKVECRKKEDWDPKQLADDCYTWHVKFCRCA